MVRIGSWGSSVRFSIDGCALATVSRNNGEALSLSVIDIIDLAVLGVGQDMLGNRQIDTVNFDSFFFFF